MMKKAILAIGILLLVATSVSAADFSLDTPHSGVNFTVRHMAISKVRGTFNDFTGSFNVDSPDTTKWTCEAVIQVASIDTRNEKRDGHLRSADFFDAENHPTITFKSTKVVPKGGDQLEIHGDLTMRGVTKPVVLDAELTGNITDPWGNERIGATAKGTINRMDFGVSWDNAMETGGLIVSHEVDITLEVEGVRPKQDG